MARKKKSEGQEVRAAFDGPDVERDQLIEFATARNREDAERASSAGESRQKIAAFLDETSLNSKALSWGRSIMKKGDKDRNKAMDIVRSMEVVLPMVKQHLGGNGPADMWDEDEPVAPADGLAKPSYKDDWDMEDEAEAGDPEIADEADDFEQHLAEVAAK